MKAPNGEEATWWHCVGPNFPVLFEGMELFTVTVFQ
jgi:hypothetical protein